MRRALSLTLLALMAVVTPATAQDMPPLTGRILFTGVGDCDGQFPGEPQPQHLSVYDLDAATLTTIETACYDPSGISTSSHLQYVGVLLVTPEALWRVNVTAATVQPVFETLTAPDGPRYGTALLSAYGTYVTYTIGSPDPTGYQLITRPVEAYLDPLVLGEGLTFEAALALDVNELAAPDGTALLTIVDAQPDDDQPAQLVLRAEANDWRDDVLAEADTIGGAGWSPDGRFVAYTPAPANSDIADVCIIAVATRATRCLGVTAHWLAEPIWRAALPPA